MNSHDTTINTVRLQSNTTDVPAVRLGLSSMLAAVDWRPTGVSPTAVLIVRHLSDPKPGRITLETTSPRPDAAWETAIRQSLTRYYQQAARPEQGSIPPDAEAVLFADESEFNACLALDLARGEVRQRWWWQVPLRSLSAAPDAGITTLLCQKAALLPATIYQLTNWRQAGMVLHQLAKPQVETLLDALAAAYELPSLLPTPTELSIHDRADNWQENGRSLTSGHTRTDTPSAPPWYTLQNWYSSPIGLTTSQTYLWGWAMSLQTNPRSARLPEFRHAAQAWLAVQTSQPTPTPTQQEATSSKKTSWSPAVDDKAKTAFTPLLVNDTEFLGQRTPSNKGTRQEVEAKPSHISDSTTKPVSTKEPAARSSPTDFQPDRARDAPLLSNWDGRPQVKTAVSPTVTPSSAPETQPTTTPINWADGLPTRLAGVFYLINVMQRLQLPSCFDENWNLSHLSPWAVLDLLARGLVSTVAEKITTDSIWLTLAELDGRLPGTPPDYPFPDPQTYALPANWLAQVELNQTWTWASNGRFFRIWSEQGFLVCQQPVSPGKQTAAEARAWLKQAGLHQRPVLVHGRFTDAPIDPADSPLLADLPVEPTRWLGFVLPYLRCWLRENVEGEDELLWQNGRLYLSSSHVDVVMPLSSIKLVVRLAGLDIDPGWQPDYGRVIQFHFDA